MFPWGPCLFFFFRFNVVPRQEKEYGLRHHGNL